MTIKPASDRAQYGDADWASPLRTLGSGAGDCRTMRSWNSSRFSRTEMDADDLRVVIVRDDKRLIEHAVLAVRSERKWLVLDNRTMAILNTEGRPRL